MVWIIYEAGSVNHEAVCGAAGSVHKEAVRDAWEAADVRRLVRVVDILLKKIKSNHQNKYYPRNNIKLSISNSDIDHKI